MPRYSASGRTDALITSLRGPSLYNIAADCVPNIVEVGIFNTTTTAVCVGLTRWTAAGTVGTAITEAKHQDPGPANDATAFNTHTANATAGAEIVRCSLGAAVGAAMIWTFGAGGLAIPVGTANGIGLFLPTGTAQHLDFYFVWDE